MATDRSSRSTDSTERPAGRTAASDDPGSVPGPGVDKHSDAEPGFHGHAPYPSDADLENRLAAARGESPGTGDRLPPPAPDQQ